MASGRNDATYLRGHGYDNVNIGEGAKAHLGDANYFAQEDPLNNLPQAADAPFNAYFKQHEPTCLPDTRVDLLNQIYTWFEKDDRGIYWLNGMAGTGKSTIARTISRKYYNENLLGASFFFSRGGGDVGNARKFFTTIAAQIAKQIKAFRKLLGEVVEEHADIARMSFRDQWNHLFLRPLSKLNRSTTPGQVLIVVDALDECDREDDVRALLQLLPEFQSLKTIRLRILITSRPESPIRFGFGQISEEAHLKFVLHNIDSDIVERDISVYLHHFLNIVGRENLLSPPWPREEDVQQLVERASGLFIWAATVYQHLRQGRIHAQRRLRAVLDGQVSSNSPEKRLDSLYISVLEQSIAEHFDFEERQIYLAALRRALGGVVIIFSPLSASSLDRILRLTTWRTDQIFEELHAIVDIPKGKDAAVRLHHPSFRDFLLDPNRCTHQGFQVDKRGAHLSMTTHCILILSETLKLDISETDLPGRLATEPFSLGLRRNLSPEVQYASLYWIRHLKDSGTELCDDGEIHKFLLQHFLHWLEALAWMGKVSDAIDAIASLESITLVNTCPSLQSFVHDMKRFAWHGRAAIQQAPLQVYCAALVFAPTKSRVRNQFTHQIPSWIRKFPRTDQDWSSLIQTLEGHSDVITRIAFSPGGRKLASASRDGTVITWNSSSGNALQKFEGHKGWVNSVSFSPNGSALASGSSDLTIKIWDVKSGMETDTVEAHSDWVTFVEYFPHSQKLVSASDDCSLKLWDVNPIVLRLTLNDHWAPVESVAFTKNELTIASASRDRTVRIWDVSTGRCKHLLEGHQTQVELVAFARDDRVIISLSKDREVRIWSAITGDAQFELEKFVPEDGHLSNSTCSHFMATASGNDAVELWHLHNGTVPRTVDSARSSTFTSVAFSFGADTLTTQSSRHLLKLWNIITGADETKPMSIGAPCPVESMIFSPSGRKLALRAENGELEVWNIADDDVTTLKAHTNLLVPCPELSWSPDEQMLVIFSETSGIHLWHFNSARHPISLDIGGDPKIDEHVEFAFSSDSQVLASRMKYYAMDPHSSKNPLFKKKQLVGIWRTASGKCTRTLETADELASFRSSDVSVASYGTEFLDLLNRIGKHVLEGYSSHSSIQRDGTLVVDSQWITSAGKKLVWLPSEYRKLQHATHGNLVAFRLKSGETSVIGLDV